MSFNQDNIIQQKTGSFSGSSGSATLDVGTTAGNAVLLIIGLLADNAADYSVTTPSGFTLMGSGPGSGIGSGIYAANGAYIKTSASADETSWAITSSANTPQVIWAAFEIAGADLGWTEFGEVLPYKRSQQMSGSVAEATSPSGTSGTSETFAGVSIAAFMAASTDTTVPTFTAYSNGFNEVAYQSASTSPKACAMGIAVKQQLAVETVSCTATHSVNSYHGGLVLVFTGLDSQHQMSPTACFGAEVGTATGLATTGAMGPGVFDAVTAIVPVVSTTNARSGSYSIRFQSTVLPCNVRWIRRDSPFGVLGSTTTNAITMWTERFHIYFADLPIVDTDFYRIEAGSGSNSVIVRYVSASSKIGVKIGTGTEQLSDVAIAADQHIGIDIEYDPRTTTHTCRWAVDYNANVGDTTEAVTQTTASTSSMTAAAITAVQHGHSSSLTADYFMDDWAGTHQRKTYPIGPIEILPRKVDPAGTPAVILANRSAAPNADNFKVFTNNGSMATWTAAGWRNALDELPPVVGGSADGGAQVANATEYVTTPIETLAFAPDYVPLGARCYWAGWAASGNPAQMVYHIYDGTDNFGYYGRTVLDSAFDDTTLRWTTCMLNHNASPGVISNTSYQLTQTKMNALAIDFGETQDANPDVGVLSLVVEVVVQPVITFIASEAEDGIFRVYVKQDRKSGTQKGYLVTTPVGRGATVYGTILGSDWSQHVDPNTAFPITVNAETINDVTAGPGLTPDQ